MSPSPAWLAELRHRLGDAVVADPDVVEAYATDWTRRFVGSPVAVVRPRREDQVVTTMHLASEAGFGVVPQGGNTGLVGGTCAPAGTVLLNLAGMNGMTVADGPALVAQAGATVAAVGRRADRLGRVFGLDMASRDSATVGGAFATNAGGLYASHFGRMRQQVTGARAVLADGTIVDTLRRSSESIAGVDPVAVLAGSEGGLAVVTSLRLRLHRPPGPTAVVLAGFDSAAEALEFLSAAPPLLAAEIFRHEELQIVMSHVGLPEPLPRHSWYLLVEADEQHTNSLAPPAAAVVGTDLWAYRDRITESLATLGVVHKFDVVVPPPALADLAARLTAEVAPHGLFVFGHVLMSDLHINVVPADPGSEVPDSVDETVYAAVEEAGGEIAGEHGIGRAKADRAKVTTPPEGRRLATALKQALDPGGNLNPGAGLW